VPDFLEFFRNQVREAIRKHRMFTRDETVLVAVSGGKDSLALWDVLIDEGYQTTGLYLDLGIFEYSIESKAKCEKFAAARGVPLIVSAVRDESARVPVIKDVTRRPPCSGCGLEALPRESVSSTMRCGGGHGPQPRRRGGNPVRLGHAQRTEVAAPVSARLDAPAGAARRSSALGARDAAFAFLRKIATSSRNARSRRGRRPTRRS
jgi:hypothetical protein